MQETKNVLEAINRLGSQGQPITRIYRQLYNENLYLSAYGKIYRNDGALTKGTTDETVDGMGMERIRDIIEQMHRGNYRFSPARRSWLEKKSGGKRPLGIASFNDKLVQEVIRMLLEAYYEPKFSNSSHGYRPNRGCHTAIEHLAKSFRASKWFIEGDIKGCFDNLDHNVLMGILQKDIHDNRLLLLIEQSLKAGVLEDWEYHQSYSGTPQGSVLSPILTNIYMNELDQWVEKHLIPKWTRGKRRHKNKGYVRIQNRLRKVRSEGRTEEITELRKQLRTTSAVDTHDPSYRRLHYIRYADDFILGFAGPKNEAEEIKEEIANYLRGLKLQMGKEKTFITHAANEQARFLGYAISVMWVNDRLSYSGKSKKRNLNGVIRLSIPKELIRQKVKAYMHKGKPAPYLRLKNESDATIVDTFQARYRGLVNFYQYAHDIHRFSKLKWVMETSLTQTLAMKHHTSVRKIYKKHTTYIRKEGRQYKVLQVVVKGESRDYSFIWGAIPLQRTKIGYGKPINDKIIEFPMTTSEIVLRLQKGECEVCNGPAEEVHHVRKLKDLKRKWQGKEVPKHVYRMIQMNRKTLVVCKTCHQKIHEGNGTTKPN